MQIACHRGLVEGIAHLVYARCCTRLWCAVGCELSAGPAEQVQLQFHAGKPAVTTHVSCKRRYWPLPIPYLLADACTVFQGARVQFRLDPNHQVATLSHVNLIAVCRNGKYHNATDASTALRACLPEK